jgi:putative thioredoxin
MGAMASEYVTDVTTEDFPTAVVQRSREVPVVVDLWAEWCGPCKVLGPVLEKLAAEANGAWELVKVDVDTNQELSDRLGVQGIPTVVAYRDGMPVSRFTGAIPEAAVRQWLEQIVPSELDRAVDEARDAALAGDAERAEYLFRAVLETRTDHPEAGTGLASLLIARGDTDEALIVLGKLVPTPEVDRLQAAARLTQARSIDVSELERAVVADPTDGGARLALARAIASHGEYEPALDRMLAVVREKGDAADEARLAMLDIFEVLTNEHPLTAVYRRQLASALY